MLREKELCKQYDLSSIRFVFSGAAPLGEETIAELEKLYPAWVIGQAYGKHINPICSQILESFRHDRNICRGDRTK
jgi:predicted HAD superfamily phosphohydrolase